MTARNVCSWRGFLLAIACCLAAPAAAEERSAIVVTPGSEQLYRAAIQRFADASPTPSAKRIDDFRGALESALEYSGVFKSLDPKAFLGPSRRRRSKAGLP